MVSIDVWNASVDFPIFDAKTRSLKKAVLGKVGGKIGTTTRRRRSSRRCTTSPCRCTRATGSGWSATTAPQVDPAAHAGRHLRPTVAPRTSSARSRRCSTWASA